MTDSNEQHNSGTRTVLPAFLSQDDMRKKLILGAIVIVLALLAFGFIAMRSLPGDALYDVKTRVIEKLNESVQTTPHAKAVYQTKRMRERLEELKTLAERGAMSRAAQEDLQALTTLHTQTLLSAVALTEDAVPAPEMLRAISDFSDVAAAMETISEREEPLQAFGEHMEDVRREVVNTYQEQVDRYVERETPENIYALVRALLTEVSDQISNAGISEDTIDDAEVYINRVGPAMAEGDYPRAVSAIAEAKRFIMIEKYGALEVSKENIEGTQGNASSTTNATTSATTTEADAVPKTTTQTPPETSPQDSFGFPD